MNAAPAVLLKQVTFAYEWSPVLKDVNLRIDPGEFLSVIGPNGGGKTTLLKLLLGLIKPASGAVRVFGEEPEVARWRVGYVPQHCQFDPMFPMRAFDVVLMGRLGNRIPIGPYRRTDKEAACEALRQVGLWELRRQPIATLSGGQRQRALIARALASNPDLLLLDEPTAHVDVAAQYDLTSLLENFSPRMTIVMVTHDVGFVPSRVKRVVCVNTTVAVHPTNELTGAVITELYGGAVSLVRHHIHHEKETGR